MIIEKNKSVAVSLLKFIKLLGWLCTLLCI